MKSFDSDKKLKLEKSLALAFLRLVLFLEVFSIILIRGKVLIMIVLM